MRIVFKTVLKHLLICAIWRLLELVFYGEIQPRMVDDIISLILCWYIYKAELFNELVKE